MLEIIKVEKLKKSFGDLEVLHSIDFSVFSVKLLQLLELVVVVNQHFYAV